MSITALLWAVLYCGAALFSLSNPLFGSLGYLLEYYMRPELKWWGDQLPALRYNLIISVVLAGTFLMRRQDLRRLVATDHPVLKWQLAFAGVMVLVTLSIALDSAISWEHTIHWVKMAIIFPLLIYGVLRSRSGFNAFIAAHMLGAFWWGWNAYIDPKRAEGRLLNIGSGDSLNDNAAAAHLLSVLPFALICLLTSKDKRMRGVALICAPFIINTLILCNSRGAMVGLAAALAAAFFLVRHGYRLRIVVAGVATVATVLLFADPQFIERQRSTTNYEEDGSAQSRLATWAGAIRLIQDYPLGAGGDGFNLLSPKYIPEVVAEHDGELRAPHNTWALVLSEWGIPGMICYLGMYGAAFLTLRRIKVAARRSGDNYFYWQAFAIQLGLISFLVASTFSDRLYAEAGYWMVALTCALYRIQRTDEAEAVAPDLTRQRAAPAASSPVPLAGAYAR